MASCTSKKPSGHRDIEVADGTKRELGGTEETYPVIVEPTETEAPSETTEEMRQEIHDLFSEYAFEISSVGNSH